ncbi:helix-turn-helix, psq domain-containing protein [Hirsutella rhossiliensis]
MVEAIFDITDNGLSQHQAAQKWGVPQRTISGRMSGFGLDSLVVGSSDPKRKALLKGPQRTWELFNE